MDDLIRRQDAIEIFSQLWGCIKEIADKDEWEDVCKTTANELPSAQQWIPCSERLPHAEYGESDNVLVTCESKCIRLLYFDGGNWCYPTGECYEHRIDKVVAWMPMPEAWKGSEDKE